MLMPSMYVQVVGTLITSFLLVADWYIWSQRYGNSERCVPEFNRRLVTYDEHTFSQHGTETEFVQLLGAVNAQRRPQRLTSLGRRDSR